MEKVITGDRVIIRLKETPTQHYQTFLLLAGIRSPSLKRTNADGTVQAGEPLSEEALDFINVRMLQRGCSVTLYGATDNNQLIGTVNHPNGNIAIFLLKEGLTRCFDHHSTIMGPDMAVMRQAEKSARDAKVGVFKNAAAPKAGGRETEVVVSRVLNAETLFLRYPDGKEKRVSLSSIRQPKPSDPKQSPFGDDAKEFMRRKLIGKHVKVSINGKRPATEGFEERELATVTQNGKNVALEVVEAGYATVIRHRMDDTDRSPIYDDLRLAEDAAQKEGKGLWAAKAPEKKQYVNYSENLEKAKRLLSLLQRQKRVPAIVDFVMGGSRFALLIPRENARITFVLSGVQVPRTARNDSETTEPFGQEGHDLAVRRLQQRDVEIDVEDNDKNGGFIGKIYVNRDNFSRVLLEEGFASVRTRSAEKSGNLAELQAAEKSAKDARKGLWHDYDPSTDVANGNAADGVETDAVPATNGAANGGSVTQQPTSTDYRDVFVTHVDDESCRLRIQTVGKSTTTALESLMSSLRALNISSSGTALSGPPKAGELLTARFSEDGVWYRARVRRVDREAKKADVLYVDYGNSEALPWTELRQLPQPEKFGVNALKYQAQEAALSFITFPSGNRDYMREAQSWLLRRCADGSQLVARVDSTDSRDGTLYISLIDPNSNDDRPVEVGVEKGNINAEALEEGLGMVTRKPQRWEKGHAKILEALGKREAEAKANRRGMWEYGDLTED